MQSPKPAKNFWKLILMFALVSVARPCRAQNPVAIENENQGSTAWKPDQGYKLSDNDKATGVLDSAQIRGYASAPSINKGESITFYITVNPSQIFWIDIYRMGWYQGKGGRLMQTIGPLDGTDQKACSRSELPSASYNANGVGVTTGTGLVECSWTPSYILSIPTSWTSGIYVAHLRNSNSYESYMIFVVRDDARKAELLYQQPVNTYQAYNQYGGTSLYRNSCFSSQQPCCLDLSTGQRVACSSSDSHENYATMVSFDRPYDGLGDGQFGVGGDAKGMPTYEIHLVRWLEQMGYDVSYSTSLDSHLNGSQILNYRGFISAGHDEYWSAQIYDSITAARDAGINLAFLGANDAFWAVRYQSSSSGVPNRVMACYKVLPDPTVTNYPSQCFSASPTLAPGCYPRWRNLGSPEQALIGEQGPLPDTAIGGIAAAPLGFKENSSFTVRDSSNWVFADTGFQVGNSIPGILGPEIDAIDNLGADDPELNPIITPQSAYFLPQNITYSVLSGSPFFFGCPTTLTVNEQSFIYACMRGYSTIYQAQSGAWVFSAGTLGWSWALDNWTVTGLLGYGGTVTYPSIEIQKTTKNILNRFLKPKSIPTYAIYAIDGSGNLHFYKDVARNGTSNWTPNSGNVIGRGWNFKQVISGNNGVIYAIDSSGNLHFYKDLNQDGTPNWASNSGAIIGNGWNFSHVFSGGNGVIYAIDSNGNLFFYKDLNQDGTENWAPGSGNNIGKRWNFSHVFSGGNGIIYAIDNFGSLEFYKDLDRNGTPNWLQPGGQVIGNGWDFNLVFGDPLN